MKNIFALSHCLLNTASKVAADEGKLRQEYVQRKEFLLSALEQDIQFLQLPCPELLMYGSSRWGHVKSQFDNPFFRKCCREIFNPILLQLKEYASKPEDFSILGIVSVEGSPSCGKNLSCDADWGGEMEDLSGLPPVKMVPQPGIFMEVIQSMLEEEGLSIPLYSLEEAIGSLSSK